ncbi:MAG: haloacid dehalogenase type II [Emcibacteraceae bacterium]|nr:haloacid dehalogenase type II [Emcibacteraceae bacterium]
MFRPKYISFDCYGTLTRFRMSEVASEMYADRIKNEDMEQFCKDFSAYRMDQVMGDWRHYKEILVTAIQRTCKKWGIEYREGEGEQYYDAVPTWGPHDDVAKPLTLVGKNFPLVILSNAMDEHIQSNVKMLEADFHAVLTAQQAQAYKPRFQAFEYMFDTLNANPEDFLHVSSSFRYDLMSAHDVGIKNKVFVGRGHEPKNSFYSHVEIPDISGLPGVVGL